MFRTASGWRALSGGLLVAAMVAGCSTTAKVGRDFAYGEFASRARQGESTKAQVQEMLGAPASQGLVLESDGSRNDQWTYFYGSAKLPSGTETTFKLLQIKFDPAGKLLSFTWSGEAGSAPPGR